MNRREFLRAGLVATPLAAALASLGGCGDKGSWAEGMQPIKWDRDTCVACSMVISDRRFAGEMRGGPKNTVFKFDDPGCVALWLHDKAREFPWMSDPATRVWIADAGSHGGEVAWLDALKAQYVTRTSPMGFNFAAVAYPQAGSVDFQTMSEHVVAKIRKGRS